MSEIIDFVKNLDKVGFSTDVSNTAARAAAALASANAAAASEVLAAQDRTAAAISASSAAASAAVNLSAFASTFHVGAVVRAIIYDTSKDSDGGAWRKRCTDKSWYTEALGGNRWLPGGYATIAAAWTAAGSATGAIFQATATAGPLTLGKYYSADSATTATEVFRGISREFPEQAFIVAEAGRVVIYDGATNGCPMWMVFISATTSALGTSSITSLACIGGALCICNGTRIVELVFPSDAVLIADNIYTYGIQPIGIHNTNAVIATPIISSIRKLVSGVVNDVAITVLSNAPIDPATGLPVPTIAVATAGGVSVIKDDGTVVNSSATGNTPRILIVNSTLWTNFVGGVSSHLGFKELPGIAASWAFTFVSAPSTRVTLSDNSKSIALNASGTDAGCIRLKHNPTTPAEGMVAYITNAYNTGWMVGDVRGAYLADTVAETIAASGELVTNGTFNTGIIGWTDSSAAGGAIAWNAAGSMNLVNTTGNAIGSQAETTVVGRTYAVTATKGGTTLSLNIGTTATGSQIYAGVHDAADVTTYFVATATTTYISAARTTVGTGTVDNISVKLAEPDRSVKGKGLIVNGTLTKSAAAAGSALVAYSGFSAANYLEQPYNSDLDFGTGDFCVMGWCTPASLAANMMLFHRTTSGTVGGIAIFVNSTSGLVSFFASSSGSWGSSANSVVRLSLNAPSLITCLRSGSIAYLFINDTLTGSATITTNVTNTLAVTRVGVGCDGVYPVTGSLALWRISATAPSADQIAQIYRDELPLFQPAAQCTIGGSSTAVTALSSDDVTDLLHVGTSAGRSEFKNLLRTSYEATPAGAITSLSANQGAVITGGTSAYIYQPAFFLRDELRRKDEARKALGKIPVFFEFDAIAAQTAFVVPKGYTAKAVYSAGTLKRLGATKDYTTSSDGYQETVTFGVAPGNTVWVSVMATRNY